MRWGGGMDRRDGGGGTGGYCDSGTPVGSGRSGRSRPTKSILFCDSQETETSMVPRHATTASPKPSFRAPWRLGDAVVGRGNAGWTTSKSEHFCPCQNCSQGPPAEKTREGYLLNCPISPSHDPVRTELN